MTTTPTPECSLPPSGWKCTRSAGHEGPCAAVPESQPPEGYEWPGLIHYWRSILFVTTITFLPSAIGNWVRLMKSSWQFMFESF